VVRDNHDMRRVRCAEPLGFVRVLLGGDEGVHAIGGGVIGDADGFGVLERRVLEGCVAGNRPGRDDDARFAARWSSAWAWLDVLEVRWFVLLHVELVRMRDARVELERKQGKAEERRRGVMGSREAHWM
jgi:hypothetical protein